MRQNTMPRTVAECLDDAMQFEAATLQALREYRRQKPWRGSLQERRTKLAELHEKLCRAYGKTTRIAYRPGSIDAGDSGGSCYVRRSDVIQLEGRHSVVTYLHSRASTDGGRAGGALPPVSSFNSCLEVRAMVSAEQMRDWADQLEVASGDQVVGIVAGLRAVADDVERPIPIGRIVVTVSGGVVQGVTGVPECCVVEIRDYDVESLTEDELPQDDEGLEYSRCEWTAEEAARWAGEAIAPEQDRLVWACPECKSGQVQSQMWVRTNTSEVLDDTGRYGWCDNCEQEIGSMIEIPHAQTLEGRAASVQADRPQALGVEKTPGRVDGER